MGKFYDNSIIPQKLKRNFDVYERIYFSLGFPAFMIFHIFEGLDEPLNLKTITLNDSFKVFCILDVESIG